MDDYGVSSSGSTGSQNGNQGDSGSSGQGGAGSSGSQTTQGQSNAQTTAYTSAYSSATTPTTMSMSQTNSASPTSTSSSSGGLSSSQRTEIIAGVLGGVGALVIISLIVIYLLQKRKAKKSGPKGVAEETSYNGLNSSFAGVPFIQGNNHPNGIGVSRPDTSYQGAHMRGGQSSYPDLQSDMETDRFLPTYEESQHRASAAANGSQSPSDILISPATIRDPFTDHSRLSQISQGTITPTTPRPVPLIRHDTMGFPLDDNDTSYIGTDGMLRYLSNPDAHNSIVAPAPIRPTISHQNLERGAWEQNQQSLPQPQPNHLNSLSSSYENENENDAVPPMNQSYNLGEQTTSPTSLNIQHAWLNTRTPTSMSQRTESSFTLGVHNPHLVSGSGSVARNMSLRTESSFAPSVVSDGELERLGVGSRMI